jgi:putative redox protein
MTINVKRDSTGLMRHIVHVGEHAVPADIASAEGGEASGLDPHDFYDAALGACKALTMLWYAKRKGIPVGDVEVQVDRDNSDERAGTYRLSTTIRLAGDLSEAQRHELLSVAAKCPVHKLMTTVTTEITTTLAEA